MLRNTFAVRAVSAALAAWLPLAGAAAQTTGCTTPTVTITHPGGTGSNLNPNQLITIDTTKYPNAICNDGTPAKYGLRLGNQSTRWIFQLQAGGSCNDNKTCLQRWSADSTGRVTGSNGVDQAYTNFAMWGKGVSNPARIPGGSSTGILSPSPKLNPDFYDANVVYVFYCTSDNWTGNALADPAKGPFNPADAMNTWNFQGRAVALSVLQDVMSRPEFANATDMLWTGTSAGAIGAVLTFNDVLPLVPPSVRVVGSADGGFANAAYPAYTPLGAAPGYLSTAVPTKLLATNQKQNTLWRGRGDAACTANVAQADRVRCYDTSYVIGNGYITQPFNMVNATGDQQHLLREGVPTCNLNRNCAAGSTGDATQPQATGYVTTFSTNALLPGLTTVPAPVSATIINSTGHVYLTQASLGYQFTPIGSPVAVTVAQVFGQYYRNPCQQPIVQDGGPLVWEKVSAGGG